MIARRSLLISGAAIGASALVAARAQAQPKNPNWPRAMVMGTASAGGTGAIWGEGAAQIMGRATGVGMSTRTTQGPVQNIVLTHRNETQMGIITMGLGLQGWNGEGEWTQGNKYRNIRAFVPMYDTPFQGIAKASSGIKNPTDLQGKRIGVGPRGGTPGTTWPVILRHLGVTPSAIRYGSANDMAGQLSDGLIDCFLFAAGLPVAAFTELEVSQPMTHLTFTAQQIALLKTRMPELGDSAIPRGVYRYHTVDAPTIGIYNFLIVHKDLPADLVEAMCDALLASNTDIARVHATGKETLPRNWNKNTFLPFHPGAAKWFRARGHAIPDNLVLA